MINKPFLITADNSYSYQDLFLRIAKDKTYYQSWRYDNLFEFLVNLLKAVVYNHDIVVLDSDFSDIELTKMGITTTTIVKELSENKKTIQNIEAWQTLIEASTAKITLFTSGTTGLPKKIDHHLSSLCRMVRKGDKYQSCVWGLAYNPTHMAGLQVLMQAFMNQNTLVYLFGEQPDTIQTLIEQHHVSHLSATPTFYRLLSASPNSLASVEKITFGGEKFDELLGAKMLLKFPNAKINNIYASTELGSLLVANGHYFKIPSQLTHHIKIEDHQLVVHQTLLADTSEVAAYKIIDGWYYTGDMVEMAADNPALFKFVRRESEIINIGGYKVNPNEVEEAILKIDGIQAARVYGKDNSVMGKILCADLVSDAVIDVKMIRMTLAAYLQDFKIPRIMKQVEQINTTRTGKINRSTTS